MMKKTITIFFLLYTQIIFSQNNLVPNYSFENFSQCPNSENQVLYAIDWKSYCSSPDYFNSCDTLYTLGVPSNEVGFQIASTGSAYCGFFCYMYEWNGNIKIREHIGTQLNSPLIVGTEYCVSVNISLTYKAGTSNCANNNIGIKFSTISYQNYAGSITSPAVNNFAHIFMPLIISDTINWTTISGSFIADSAYNYIMIGNFFDNNNTDTLILNSNDSLCYSYYYVDDVVVTLCDTTAVEDLQVSDYKFQVIPNPASAEVTVSLNAVEIEDFVVTVSDITGRKIQEYYLEKNNLIIPTGEFDNGIYFLSLYNKNNIVSTRKLVVAK